MPKLDIQAAKARCEAASPGPWEPSGAKNDVLDPNLDIIACFCEREDYDADSEFIAHARTDLPAALEALEEAQEHRDQWKKGYRQAVEEGVSVLAQYEEANAHLEVAEDTIEEQHERLEEAQGKLEAVEKWRLSRLWGRWPEGADELARILSKEGNE